MKKFGFKYIFVAVVVAIAAFFCVSSCTKPSTFDINDYDVSINVVDGELDASDDIFVYPKLRVRIIGPSSGSEWKLVASVPGEPFLTSVLREGETGTLELSFVCFDVSSSADVLVKIESVSSGAVLYTGIHKAAVRAVNE